MKKNVFDMGYEVVWVGYCKAHLKKISSLPIVEFYKVTHVDDWTGKKTDSWSFRELTISDIEIDKALPNDWKIKKVTGFSKFDELNEWLCTHSPYLRNS